MKEKLEALRSESLADLESIQNLDALEAWETKILGRKSQFNLLMKGLGSLAPNERKKAGRRANEIKVELQEEHALKLGLLKTKKSMDIVGEERIDIGLPGTLPPIGHLHLVSQAIAEIESIFSRIGFYRVSQPEVEWEWYAFESLNMPPDHPARDEWETFFMDAPQNSELGKMVLTPHTSSGQVREMQRRKPPIRMVGISKCYRRQMDVSHVPMFHQFLLKSIFPVGYVTALVFLRRRPRGQSPEEPIPAEKVIGRPTSSAVYAKTAGWSLVELEWFIPMFLRPVSWIRKSGVVLLSVGE
jgi:phenylalanyl-tRNA synthetase alpha chain